MVKTPLEILVQEHVTARNIVAILKVASRNLKEKKTISLMNLSELMKSITDVMEMHHKKEMEIFPYLAEAYKVKKDDLIEMLAEEHRLGLEYLSNISKIVSHEGRGEDEKNTLLPFHIDQYTKLLAEHIEKEEDGFFPAVKNSLGTKESEYLEKKFGEIEKCYAIRGHMETIAEAKKRYR